MDKPNKYHNNHLIKNSFRGEYLYNVIQPYLNNNDVIVDVGCGYSPIGKFVEDEYKYVGIDIDEKCMNILTNDLFYMIKDNITFINTDITNLDINRIDVLLLIGTIWFQNNKKSLIQLVNLYKPRVVLIEGFASGSKVIDVNNLYLKGTRNWYWIRSFNTCLEVLYKFHYKIKDSGEFTNTQTTLARHRTFTILVNKTCI